MTTLVVVGSGSLARSTCLALSSVQGPAERPATVLVLARNSTAAADLCHAAEVRSVLSGRALSFVPIRVDPTDHASVAAVLERRQPAGVVVCASAQSPWEHAVRPSAWTQLLRRAGIGVALPLQAQVALTVARAVRQRCPQAYVVNACFPDAVNPLLKALGSPVLSGVGNVGLLAAALQTALGLPDQSRLHVLAHHLHLHVPSDPHDEALAWLDGRPIHNVTAHLRGQRHRDRRGLNDVTGLLTAQLITDLLTGATRDTHLPGVEGRPGGYPVRISGGSVTLRLPADVDEAMAVRANVRWGMREGVSVEEDHVRFDPPVTDALAPLLPAFDRGFALGEFTDILASLDAVRERLRKQPAADPAE